jgi:hypothetical protein
MSAAAACCTLTPLRCAWGSLQAGHPESADAGASAAPPHRSVLSCGRMQQRPQETADNKKPRARVSLQVKKNGEEEGGRQEKNSASTALSKGRATSRGKGSRLVRQERPQRRRARVLRARQTPWQRKLTLRGHKGGRHRGWRPTYRTEAPHPHTYTHTRQVEALLPSLDGWVAPASRPAPSSSALAAASAPSSCRSRDTRGPAAAGCAGAQSAPAGTFAPASAAQRRPTGSCASLKSSIIHAE